MLPPELLKDAKTFVNILRDDPKLLHTPELSFLKNYLLSLGAHLPPQTDQPNPETKIESDSEGSLMDDEPVDSEESELDFDRTHVITDEPDESQQMGDDSVDVSDEMSEKADEKRCEAQSKFAEGEFTDALSLFTESILANPTMAVCFAKRAACYIKLNKPSCAIKDCNKAISLNPDSAQAYKSRGFAKKLLGEWEVAYLDLQKSLQFDYSDDANDAIKELEPIYKRIHEHKTRWERKLADRKYRDLQKAREARQKAYEKTKKQEAKHCSNDCNMPDAKSCPKPGCMPGGMPGRMPPGMENVFGGLFSDPEMMSAMQDPEIQSAFSEGMSNPAAFAKAQNNPKFKNLMKKMQEQMGGAGASFVPPGGPKESSGDDLD